MSNTLLYITDGTTRISLHDPISGYILQKNGWIPTVANPKSDGVFRESLNVDGRRLVSRPRENTIDTFNVILRGSSMDDVIERSQEMRRLLEKAVQYWTSQGQRTPVWIVARGAAETNTRYALIHDYRYQTDGNPFEAPAWNSICVNNNGSAYVDLSIILEHGYWMNNPPNVGQCVEVATYDTYCHPAHLVAPPAGGYIEMNTHASMDDLPFGANGFTFEGWFAPEEFEDVVFPRANGALAWKGINGWGLYVGYFGLNAFVPLMTTGADCITAGAWDGDWHHIAMCYNDTDKVIRIWIDGVEATYTTNITGVGAMVASDAGTELRVGKTDTENYKYRGKIGWIRISDIERYAHDFQPPSRCLFPDDDADTVGIWVREGEGVNADNWGGSGFADGVIGGNLTWECDCPQYFGALDYTNPGLGSAVIGTSAQEIARTSAAAADGYSNGTVLNTSAIEVIIGNNGNSLSAALIFPLDVPRNSYITGAYLDVIPDATLSAATCKVKIRIEDTANAPLLTTKAQFDSRTKYSEEVAWTAGSWTSGANEASPDISTLIQHIVLRDDWVAGQNVCIFLDDDSSTANAYREIKSWEQDPSHPYLIVDYVYDIPQEINAVTTCDRGEIFVANKGTKTQLMYIFGYDDSLTAYTDNYIDQEPGYTLSPAAVPAVDDCIYFGTDSRINNNSQFSNLVFNLSTASLDYEWKWEYWDSGSWSALTVLDNTATRTGNGLGAQALDTTGVNSVVWEIPADWAVTTVNGVSGWFVRLIITAIDAGQTLPVQAGYHVYTVSWPFAVIESDQVGGDIPAIAAINVRNESMPDDSTSPDLRTNRAIVSLRSTSRGINFSPYINLHTEAEGQNHYSISISDDSANLATQASVDSPIGKCMRYNPAGATAMAKQMTITFADDLVAEYIGTYRAYLRFRQNSGAAGTVRVKLGYRYGQSPIAYTQTKWPLDVVSTESHLLDMGIVNIGSDLIAEGETGSTFQIEIHASSTVATPQFDLLDLVLMPVDEWAGVFSNAVAYMGNRSDEDLSNYLQIDSVLNQRSPFRAVLKLNKNDAFAGMWAAISNGQVILQANRAQRVFFLFEAYDSGNSAWVSQHEALHSVWITASQRYLSARGRR